MPQTLIINADDLGFSPGVTDGILRAHREGVLTSATLMVTMPDRDRAIELARQTPTLGVGIHLALTQGTPLTHCTQILNPDGTFPRKIPALALRLLGETAVAQAEAEWDAQIQYALDRGLTPTHLDAHKHVHHLPMLQRAVVNVARRFEIAQVRTAREIQIPGLPAPSIGYRILMHCAHKLAARLARHHLDTADYFYGLAATGTLDLDAWMHIVHHLPEGVTEVMVHPGDPAGLTRVETRLLAARRLELEALCDPRLKQALREAGITLAHYGNART